MRSDFAALRGWLAARGYAAQMLCGSGGRNLLVVAVDKRQGKSLDTREKEEPEGSAR